MFQLACILQQVLQLDLQTKIHHFIPMDLLVVAFLLLIREWVARTVVNSLPFMTSVKSRRVVVAYSGWVRLIRVWCSRSLGVCCPVRICGARIMR